MEPSNSGTKSKTRSRNVAKHKRVVSKKLRNLGQAYKGYRDVEKSEKKMEYYSHTCRYKCNDNFTESDCNEMFSRYWALGSWNLQTAFLTGCVQTHNPKRVKRNPTTRTKTKSTIISLDNKRVCKEFYLRTFDISNGRFSRAIKQHCEEGITMDKRGRHEPKNKIPEHQKQIVVEHIHSFPSYLCDQMNINLMYKLYLDFCKKQDDKPVKIWYYRHIFNTEFKIT